MSKNVTLDQAQKLCAIGFNRLVGKSYNVSTGEITSHVHVNANTLDGAYYSCPTVSDALDYLREEKGIVCSVWFDRKLIKTKDQKKEHCYYYFGVFFIENGINRFTERNDTHPLASSALLDAVLDYLEQKEQKIV